jgi:hypothetical protein
MKIIGSLLGVVFTVNCLAQSNGNYLHNRYAVERLTTNSAGTQSNSIPIMNTSAPPGVKGDVYLNKFFSPVVFQLYDGDKIVEGYLAKLDLKQNEFDIFTKDGVKALRGTLIKSFIMIDSLTKFQSNYVSTKEFKTPEGASFPEGFFEILAEGKLTLLALTEITVKKPDFNPALNVGSKDYKIIKKEQLYYNAGSGIVELPTKKNFIKLFPDHQKEIDDYMAINNLSSSKMRDVVKTFEFYNEFFR